MRAPSMRALLTQKEQLEVSVQLKREKILGRMWVLLRRLMMQKLQKQTLVMLRTVRKEALERLALQKQRVLQKMRCLWARVRDRLLVKEKWVWVVKETTLNEFTKRIWALRVEKYRLEPAFDTKYARFYVAKSEAWPVHEARIEHMGDCTYCAKSGIPGAGNGLFAVRPIKVGTYLVDKKQLEFKWSLEEPERTLGWLVQNFTVDSISGAMCIGFDIDREGLFYALQQHEMRTLPNTGEDYTYLLFPYSKEAPFPMLKVPRSLESMLGLVELMSGDQQAAFEEGYGLHESSVREEYVFQTCTITDVFFVLGMCAIFNPSESTHDNFRRFSYILAYYWKTLVVTPDGKTKLGGCLGPYMGAMNTATGEKGPNVFPAQVHQSHTGKFSSRLKNMNEVRVGKQLPIIANAGLVPKVREETFQFAVVVIEEIKQDTEIVTEYVVKTDESTAVNPGVQESSYPFVGDPVDDACLLQLYKLEDDNQIVVCWKKCIQTNPWLGVAAKMWLDAACANPQNTAVDDALVQNMVNRGLVPGTVSPR